MPFSMSRPFIERLLPNICFFKEILQAPEYEKTCIKKEERIKYPSDKKMVYFIKVFRYYNTRIKEVCHE